MRNKIEPLTGAIKAVRAEPQAANGMNLYSKRTAAALRRGNLADALRFAVPTFLEALLLVAALKR